jgi:hypothetical protein
MGNIQINGAQVAKAIFARSSATRISTGNVNLLGHPISLPLYDALAFHFLVNIL